MSTMKPDFKGTPKAGGTYRIVNTRNGKTYYGSARNFQTRYKTHLRDLMKNRHCNLHLQNAWNLDSTGFIFEVLEVLGTKQEWLDAEQVLLDQYWDGCVNCYNIRKTPWSRDGIPSKDPESTSRKMQSSRKGYHHPEETKRKIEDANKVSLLGKVQSDATKQKRIASLTGQRRSEESKGKMRIAQKGRVVSLETRARQRAAKLGIASPKKGIPSGVPAWNKGLKGPPPANKGLPGLRGMQSATAKVYEGIRLASPDGTIYTRIECLTVFAREHGLSAGLGNLCGVLGGKVKSYKGWHLLPPMGSTGS